MAEQKQKQPPTSESGESGTQKEKGTAAAASGQKEAHVKKEKPQKDYWDRIADDVAAGYESEDDENSILNVDQEPHDHERGDTAPDNQPAET